jgi:hypothetical protein
MTTLISFPFRLSTNGSVATREDGDEDYYAEELAVLLMTVPGERVLLPGYGLNDPTFAELDQSVLTAQVALYGPPVAITSLSSTYTSDTQQDVVVGFEPINELTDDYDFEEVEVDA